MSIAALAGLVLTGVQQPARAAAPDSPAAITATKNVKLRGTYRESWKRFTQAKEGHVAFLGGSITEMNGYRPMVATFLEEAFPETEFTFTNAGIASTCSTTGACRLTRDVLSHGPVDLLFVEFAVNDDQDAAHTREECIRGMEGIVAQARRHNPRVDIVFTYFVNPEMLEQLRAGQTPLPMAAHEAVAEQHGIGSIHLAKEVAERIDAGELTWEVYGGTHPAPAGNAIAAELIRTMLTAVWNTPAPDPAEDTSATLLDPYSYTQARLLPLEKVETTPGWSKQVPNWSQIPGSCRTRFRDGRLLVCETPHAELTIEFTGRAVGAYVLAGPDAGMLEFSIDNGPYASVDLWHRFSRNLHYPRTVMFRDDLDDREHVLRVRLANEHHPESTGTAARILSFVAN